MRSLSIPTPPPCFHTMTTIRPNGPWFNGSDPTEKACRVTTRQALLTNQDNTCGWCEAKISILSSHSEHIKPKGVAPYQNLTFSIENLIACCGNSTSPTCGHRKGQMVLAGWIQPYHTAHLEKKFIFHIDGKMVPKAAALTVQEQAEATDAIDNILNLNESVLKGRREALIDDILSNELYDGFTVDQIFVVVGEFRSVIEQHVS